MATASCRTWPAPSGLREVRYGYEGENHLKAVKDQSNPYFTFDPSKCIVCSRCVRACEEVQGTFALTIDGRGFDSKVSPGQMESFMDSECVSCGACVQACPTATLMDNSVIEAGTPDRSVTTTCAYCGVGCSFNAELKGAQVVRMTPNKDGHANHGHSCVKGRFAWGYATHPDRIQKPMIRKSINDPWQEVTLGRGDQLRRLRVPRIQAKYGRDSVGAISSSRCTNEETYLMQKLVRAAFGNNNIDTCARVCHSPTGFGLKQTLGESAGTQDFDSIRHTDVVLIIGANPTDGHPVFASHMKRRLREGAKLIIADPRRIDLVRSPHVEADYHLKLRPGTNVALITALAHVVVTEGLVDEKFVRERCEWDSFERVEGVRRSAGALARGHRGDHRRARRGDARGGPPLRHRRQWRHLLRPRRHRAQPGLDHGHGHRQPGDGHRQHGSRGRGREPAPRPEQRAGRLRHGFLPARAARLSPRARRRHARALRGRLGRAARARAGPPHSQHVRRRARPAASRRSTARARTSPSPTRTPSTSPRRSSRWSASWCRTSS